jgi:hypothetical protein
MKTYTGIDHHKQYSVACTLDVQGRKVAQAKLAANAPEAFAAYFAQFDEPSEVVIEACWNWGAMHDLLETTPGVQSVTVSHPAKNRIIAEAQIKNDKVDAQALATLLRGNFVSRVHVPSRSQRPSRSFPGDKSEPVRADLLKAGARDRQHRSAVKVVPIYVRRQTP